MPVDVELLAKYSQDRAAASIDLFSHRHPQSEAPMHIEIMDLCASADQLVGIEAFREAGKTTKIEEYTILAGCFGNYPYGLWLGETYEKACQRLAAIDLECRMNDRLNMVFGGHVLARKSNENKIWFSSGTLLQAVGWEQELQSFKQGTFRPTYAVLDDVENKVSVRDKAAVDQAEDKLYDELMPAMDQLSHKIINGQTRLAEDCMMTRCANDPNWLYRGYPITVGGVDPDDPAAVAQWPARYPIAWVRKLKQRYERKMSSFLRVYMLQATNPATKPFREDRLGEIALGHADWMPRMIIYDPARTTHERRTREQDQSARCGKVVASTLGSKIIVHESGGFFWKPSQLIDDLFAANDKHKPVKIVVEKDSLDEWLMEPVRIRMVRTGKILPIFPVNAPHDRSKDEFIQGTLQPFFDANEIVLVGGKLAHPQLVAEMANYPQGLRDILNALAYAIRMSAGFPIYEDFSGANIGEAPLVDRGETIHVFFNASPVEVVAGAVIRQVRRLHVARDWSGSGATLEAVRSIAQELRANYPEGRLQSWIPAEVFDQYQRIPLVPALRALRLSPYRGEHVAVARGCLSQRISTEWHHKRLLVVDRKATLTLNALARGYALPGESRGHTNPEPGLSRLAAEGLECMVAKLDTIGSGSEFPEGARVETTSDGRQFISARPRR